jgi:hypothetical protein
MWALAVGAWPTTVIVAVAGAEDAARTNSHELEAVDAMEVGLGRVVGDKLAPGPFVGGA